MRYFILVALSIKFTYVSTYPEEAPIIEIADSEDIADEDLTALLEFLQSRVRKEEVLFYSV